MHETRLVVRRSRAISIDVGARPFFEFDAVSLSTYGRRAQPAQLQAQIGKLAIRATPFEGQSKGLVPTPCSRRT
jgi:hypothetical protein